MASSVKFAPSQTAFLDAVRLFSAQIVLIGHSTGYFMAGGFDRGGQLECFGVLLFFLLSGFLITSSVLQKLHHPGYDFRHYLIDRFCRIFTVYVPALVFIALVDGSLRRFAAYPYRHTARLTDWLGNLFMLQEFPAFQVLRRLGVSDQSWFISVFGSGRPLWTVAIEWWIYLFFGYVAFFVCRRGRLLPRDLLMLLPLGIVPFYNAMGGVGQCLSFVWMIGALAAILHARFGAAMSKRWILAGIGFSALLLGGRIVAAGVKVYDLQCALFVAGILFGLFLLCGKTSNPWPRLLCRVTGFGADYSYSLYLVHYTVLIFLVVHFPSPTRHDPALFALTFVAANVVAMLFRFLFERHYHAIAARWKAALDRRAATPQPGEDLRPVESQVG
jgi:peptidoglycan/LPS O-acetylase OafA/YrhL